jgi:hypothetical protein
MAPVDSRQEQCPILLEYYELVRLHPALGGVALLAVAIWLKLTRRDCLKAGT